MTRISARRSGAALILALLAIVVLDCVMLGTLHLALQENRIATNRSSVLQLRLDADGGARRALAFWSEELDTLPPGAAHRVQVPAGITRGAVVHVERLDPHLYLIESVAAEPAPRAGRAISRLLLTPPALPPDIDPAAAAATSGVSVHVTASGSVEAITPTACGLPAGNSIMAPPFAITTDPAATIAGPTATPGPDALVHSIPRLLALSPADLVSAGDTAAGSGSHLVVISPGNLTVAGDASGILIAGGSITVSGGATFRGAIHAAGSITVAGTVIGDPCATAAAIDLTRLGRPRPAPGRAWLPGF